MAEAAQGASQAGVRWTEAVPISLTTGSILLFGLATIPISRYYERFGLAPRDVGLDWVSTLIQSYGLVVLVVAITTATTLGTLRWRARELRCLEDELGSKLGEIYKREDCLTRKHGSVPYKESKQLVEERGAARDSADKRRAKITRIALGTAIALLVGAFFVLDLLLIQAATSRATGLREGHPAQPVRLVTLTLLPLNASPVEVEWTLPPASSPPPLRGFLLGEAGGVTTIFEPATGKTIRFPTSTAVVTLREP